MLNGMEDGRRPGHGRQRLKESWTLTSNGCWVICSHIQVVIAYEAPILYQELCCPEGGKDPREPNVRTKGEHKAKKASEQEASPLRTAQVSRVSLGGRRRAW
jgi:hypothetical protein